MWWDRPWRWIIELVFSATCIGLLNAAGTAMGTAPFLGVGWAGRFAAVVGLTVVLDLKVIPSPEKMDRGDPLPPLPKHEPDERRRSWTERRQVRR
jgi:hypothetical protein